MKMGEFPLAEAEGAVLAHSVKLGTKTFKKGRILSAADLATIAAAGRDRVMAARLEPSDVGEDTAATALAEAVAGENLRRSVAFTGRCNLFAEARGLAVIDRQRLDRVNLVDEAITIATVPPYEIVEPKQMVATIKVIPFAVSQALVDACIAAAAGATKLIGVATFKRKRIGLIQTLLPGLKPSVIEGTVEATRLRVEGLGCELHREIRCPHEEAETAAAVAQLKGEGCDIVLIMGASANTDRRDVVPLAIERLGGAVDHVGMPVDPGNLLVFGHVGEVPTVGLPGCARSPKFNGFDWVLQRLAADVKVTREDIMRMGAGGLLTEISSRPLPRANATKPADAVQRAAHITGVVLAAGIGKRMGANKMATMVDGAPMISHVVDSVIASHAKPVIVVTGHEPERVRDALKGRNVTFVHNPDYATGQSTSLRAGIAAVPADADGAIVCLGDMPRIKPADIDRIVNAFNPVEGRGIVVPTWKGKRGNPILWARRFFDEMKAVSGDIGARQIISAHGEAVYELEMGDDSALVDVDTPEALASLAPAMKATA
ncbi:MAG: 4-diphosphocytidyl-2C-methyl-D-erythritol kinase [Rhodospirillaceae bacterium]|nr:4-diphosphocytidyl-2C-methyl-D-erythritol kinase [Rhodospirillaceae bacterium]